MFIADSVSNERPSIVEKGYTVKRVAVMGLGKVGRLAASLLADSEFQVTGYDAAPSDALHDFDVVKLDMADQLAVVAALNEVDAVLSCLPFHLNIRLAEQAHTAGIHYFDLTEDVTTTMHIQKLAETSKGLMAPQCGLAPGFVGIVGSSLIADLDNCRACKMRVGALPQNPTGLMGYAFNWSPEGVVNEYLNDCEVLEDGEIKMVSPMEWVEKLYIDGVELEAFTTSGGLGTMCQTYQGRVPDMDYKTMRYPGHVQLMNFFFHELLMRDRKKDAGEILVNAKPPVNQDVVYVHVSAEGESAGRLTRSEFVRAYKPETLVGVERTAIAWTTASSVTAVIEMVRDGKLPQKGFLKQEDIALDNFLQTKSGALFDI